VTAGELSALYAELEERAAADFEAQSGARAEQEPRRSAALRYQGQNYEQEVPIPGGELTDGELVAVYERFAQLYEGFYGYRLDGIPIELVRLQVVLAGEAPRLEGVRARPGDQDASVAGSRDVWFPEAGFVPASILRRESLLRGAAVDGPLVVEEMDSTIVVPPHWRLTLADADILELTRKDS
jgi:N-methylhydantoinase A